MSLLPGELERCKFELGFNSEAISALSYMVDGVTSIFSTVVQQFLNAGELNYSSTPIPVFATPTPIVLQLQNTPTQIKQGDTLVIDQDGQQEVLHAQVVTMSTVQIVPTKLHVGTYPITVQGGESMVRYILQQCISVQDAINESVTLSGLKRVSKIEFYGSSATQKSARDELIQHQRYWRNELSVVLGVPNLREKYRAGGGNVEAY